MLERTADIPVFIAVSAVQSGYFHNKVRNLVFLSALKLLEQLTEKGLLTVDEAEKSRIELERKLRPTLLFA